MSERILLIRLSAIGDVIHALHGVASLRAARPDAFLGFLVEDRAASLLRGHPQLDRLHVYPRAAWQRGLLRCPQRVVGEAADFLAGLRGARYDVAVDLQGNLKGGLLSALSGAPRRIGLDAAAGKEGNQLFQTHRVSLPPGPLHRVDRVHRLLEPLGVRPGGEPRVAFHADDDAEVDAYLAREGLVPGRFAVLHPGTSEFGRHKRWPTEGFSELARRLRERHGLPSVVTFGPGERELATVVVRGAGGAARPGPVTRRLSTLARLATRSALFVAADTGALHLAALLGVPTVGLFGPKDPRVYGARGPRSVTVDKGVDCSPCPKRSCPDPVCMRSITCEDVLEAVEPLIPAREAALAERGVS